MRNSGMTSPVIYYDPTSEPCRAVHWLCIEANIPYQLEYVWLTRNEHLSKDFLKINPFHQVPAMEYRGFCLSEASAIMRYLMGLNECTESWFGSELEEKAVIDQRLSWYHTNLRKILTLDYFLPVLLLPAYLNIPKPEASDILQRKESVHLMFEQLDSMLRDRPFLAGTTISAPDILFASEIAALQIDLRYTEILSSFSDVEKWLISLHERPAYQESHRVWNRVATQIAEAVNEPGSGPEWVAEACEQLGD
jgi:glutathione S-transferase